MAELLEVVGVGKEFASRRSSLGRVQRSVAAVRDVSFTLAEGRTLAIVGESGAGKSTLGRLVLRLIEPDHGQIRMGGVDVLSFGSGALRRWRSHAQMVFQNPYASLDPRMTIGASVAEPLAMLSRMTPSERRARVADLLDRVGLDASRSELYPYEFSGGQLQRIAIARAVATNPQLIVCDEPVAALDMSVRAQVLNLLLDLQNERRISYLFISHDLSLVRAFSHDVAVMYQGRLVEVGATAQIFARPAHPYTRALLQAVPVPNPRVERARRGDAELVAGSKESTGGPSSVPGRGCAYAPRCPHVISACRTWEPTLVGTGAHRAACLLVQEPAEEPVEKPTGLPSPAATIATAREA
jgi:peptide/nickel transport system ATP-binding protein/oligopeptide transport system ATP-binding protein